MDTNKITNQNNQNPNPQNPQNVAWQGEHIVQIMQDGGTKIQPDILSEVQDEQTSINRLLYRKEQKLFTGDSGLQTLNVKESKNAFPNPNNPIYYKTTEFPQPAIAGIGEFTGAATVAKSSSLVFQPQSWTLSRTSAGVYKITHNIGNTLYMVFAQINSGTTSSYLVYVNKANNYFEINVVWGGAKVDPSEKIQFVVYTTS